MSEEKNEEFAQAVDHAVSFLRSSMRSSFCFPLPRIAGGGLEAALLQGKGYRQIKDSPEEIVEASKHDADAFDSLRFGIAQLLSVKEELPEAVRDWLIGYLFGKQSQPKKRQGARSKAGLNLEIYMLVYMLVNRGMQATRNDASEPISACDAVAKALRIVGLSPASYSRVKAVWLEISRYVSETGRSP